jgi:hypothetical protein
MWELIENMGMTMRISTFKFMVLSIFCTFLFYNDGRAYDNTTTHRYINEKAVKGISTIDTVLQSAIGFDKGIYEIINEKRIWEWIREGGYQSWRCSITTNAPRKGTVPYTTLSAAICLRWSRRCRAYP